MGIYVRESSSRAAGVERVGGDRHRHKAAHGRVKQRPASVHPPAGLPVTHSTEGITMSKKKATPAPAAPARPSAPAATGDELNALSFHLSEALRITCESDALLPPSTTALARRSATSRARCRASRGRASRRLHKAATPRAHAADSRAKKRPSAVADEKRAARASPRS